MKTDANLQEDVLDELKWWPNVEAAHIGVTASNGVVTLTGQVGHYADKAKAESAAKAVSGVLGIANDIVVEPAGSSMRTDQDIAAAALNAMKWNSEVPVDKITVVVNKGCVRLEGTVDWQFQRDAAWRAVHYLLGVKGVTNSVSLQPTVRWADVTVGIEDAFRRNAHLEAGSIRVSTDSGKVTLAGTVRTPNEREEAGSTSWAAPGVTRVVNDLLVV